MLNFKVIITQRGGARPCGLGHWNLNLLIQNKSPALTTHTIWNRLWFNSPAKYPTGLPFPVGILEQFSSFVVFRCYLLLGYSRSIFKYLKVVTSGTGLEYRIRAGVVSYRIVSYRGYSIVFRPIPGSSPCSGLNFLGLSFYFLSSADNWEDHTLKIRFNLRLKYMNFMY